MCNILFAIVTYTYWKSHEITNHDFKGFGFLSKPASEYFGIVAAIGIFFLVLGILIKMTKDWQTNSKVKIP